MSDGVIILGAGGHAKVIADIILSRGENLVGFLDDNATGAVLGYPILGTLADIAKYQDECSFIIGIGNNQTRKGIAERSNVNWHTAIHPSAIIARDIMIGDGSVVMAGAIINPSVSIGRHCIINTATTIEHDNVLDDFVHISPNATLCGTVHIGSSSHIGAGTVITNNTSICEGCIVGAGAVVVNDLNQRGLYVGVPAIMKKALSADIDFEAYK